MCLDSEGGLYGSLCLSVCGFFFCVFCNKFVFSQSEQMCMKNLIQKIKIKAKPETKLTLEKIKKTLMENYVTEF